MPLLKTITHGGNTIEFHDGPNKVVYVMHNGARKDSVKKFSKVEVIADGKPVPLKNGSHVITSVNPTCIWYQDQYGVWHQYCY